MRQKIALKVLHSGTSVFLTGSAGTGKTHVINEYIQYLRERGVEPAVVAPTGIAASHIDGKTIHSFFCVGIRDGVDDGYLSWLLNQKFLHRRLDNLSVLIVDEVSMVSPELFLMMDKILRAFKHSEKPFGGVQVIFSGDFFQLPPISKKPREIKFVWQTDLWQSMDLKVCYLEEKFRQDDDALIGILEEIRAGGVSESSMEIFRSCYKKKLANNFRATKLYTHNVDVDRINKSELGGLPGDAMQFRSKNRGAKKDVERIFKSSLVAEELGLKEGAMVIFIKNNYDKGYINGTLGKVVYFSKMTGLPVVEIFSGREILVDLDEWVIEDDKGEIKASVKQIPLRLAWALTIHKSQGMTLDAAEIDLSKTFEVGQGYVALSRIKSIEGLRLMGLNDVALMVDELVLGIDQEMKDQSKRNSSKFKGVSEDEIKEMSRRLILEAGGTVRLSEIKKNQIRIQRAKEEGFMESKKQKGDTVEATKEMAFSKKSISEIALKRKLSEVTIVTHLQKIKELNPDFDIDYLKPKKKNLKLILNAAQEVKKRENKDDFSEDGRIKLKPVFENLDKKISYDEIRVGLLFLDS